MVSLGCCKEAIPFDLLFFSVLLRSNYPFFASGVVVATAIERGLFLLQVGV